MAKVQTLEEKVEAREAQAEKRQILTKSMLVVSILGTHSEWQDETPPGVIDYDKYKFNRGHILIEDEEGTYHYGEEGSNAGKGLKIEFNGKLVYKYCVGLKVYIPGKWEGLLDTLYAEALAAEKSKKKTEQKAEAEAAAAKERELKKKFAL